MSMSTATPIVKYGRTVDYLRRLTEDFHLSQSEIARRMGRENWQSQISYVLKHGSGGDGMYEPARKLYEQQVTARNVRNLLGSGTTIRPGVGVSVPSAPVVTRSEPEPLATFGDVPTNGALPEPTLNRVTLRDWLGSGENMQNRPRIFLAPGPNKNMIAVERTAKGQFYLWVDTSQSDIPQDIREPAMSAREVRLALSYRGYAALLDETGILFKR